MSQLPKGIVVLVDGGCLNNQTAEKRHAYGSIAVFHNGQKQRFRFTDEHGKEQKARQVKFEWGGATNNQAELKTAIAGLGWILEFYRRLGKMMPVTLCSDSEMVVNTAKGINKKFRVPEIAALAGELKAKLDELPLVSVEYVDNGTVKSLLGH